ncbi:MAG: SpoIIE family protein phosphatase [Burkholderiales bacterium]|nr:SpoIIE family protein phosphatase [Burkholderiales bacterium]
MNKQIRRLCAVTLALLASLAVHAQNAFVVDDNTPVIFSDTTNVRVLQAPSPETTLEDVRDMDSQFVPANAVLSISPTDIYWIKQTLVNQSLHEKQLRIAATGWTAHQNYVVRKSSVEKLQSNGNSANYNWLAEINPFITPARNENSQYAIFNVRSGETVDIYSRVKSHSSVPAKTFSLNFYDHASYLELRRFGVYFEGGMLGLLIALAVFGWYSYVQNRDNTSLAYGVWLTVGVTQCLFLPVHDGQRVTEFFVHMEDQTIGWQYLAQVLYSTVSYAQTVLYVVFARNFLDLKIHFPIFYKVSNIWIGWEIIHLVVLLTQQHTLNQKLFWLPLMIPIVLMLLSIYVCAYIRLQQGLTVAKFFMIAMVPYMFFRVSFMLGIAGFQSPFSFLPQSGFGFFFQNTNTNQAFGVCCEAMIMALAVISRTRWLQQELANSIQSQNDLMANQNKVLEHTVAERTKELAEQHQALDEAHQLVVGSVNYASRLQRGQLPRPVRLENRFASFATIWEPRDTIGGDLYWVSSSQHDGPFVLSVADCTGHGVPGAMLSLLVSNSLERIYANDTMEDPVSALTSLDHFVRTGLNQDRADSESDDGCDATVLRIDRRLQRVEYAGAKIDLFHVNTAGVVTRHMAQRVSLGYKDRVPLSEVPPVKVLPYQKGDLFAIVTDGLTDQVGGEPGKPKVSYGYRRLEQLLSAHAGAHAQQVIDALRQDFARWQGKNTRRDDVTAVVFSL